MMSKAMSVVWFARIVLASAFGIAAIPFGIIGVMLITIADRILPESERLK